MHVTEEEAEGGILRAWEVSPSGVHPVTVSSTPNDGRQAPASLLSRIAAELQSIFLPAGYPESVRSEYLKFQIFDTLQAACSYLRNVLTTSALLQAAGVGEDAASPMAAALAWVLRDGFGMFGSLIFSYFAGAAFDRNVKEWRLFADVINDVGLTLDMLAPHAGSFYAITAALAAACKSICGMVAGATRASITAHFAIRGNLADVSAKENAQETAVNLIGLVLGSFVANRLGDSPTMAWATFLVLTALHVWANTVGVGCLTFDFINAQRAHLLARSWASMADPADASSGLVSAQRSRVYMSPARVSCEERFWRPLLLWLRGPRIGVGLSGLVDRSAADGGAQELVELNQLFAAEQYLLRLDANGQPAVALRPGATGATLLKAWLHCAALEDGRFFLATRARKREWVAKLGLAPQDLPVDLRLYGLHGVRPSTAPAGGDLSLEERLALEESLRYTSGQWPAFCAAVKASGWREAAVRLDLCCGPTRVRFTSGKERAQ